MSDEYRSYTMFVGMPTTGLRGQVTLRGGKDETGEAYAKRVLNEIELWRGLGWRVERPFVAEGKIENAVNVEPMPEPPPGEPEPATVPAPKPATSPAATVPGGTMRIVKAEIVSDRGGLPQLEMYAAGHKFPDLRYSLGKDLEARQANLVKLLSGLGKTPNPTAIKIGYKQDVNWSVTWKQGREPKYKDVVSIGPYVP